MKVTICGSMVFHAEMEDIAARLREQGHEVEVPLLLVETIERGQGGKMSLRAYIESRGGIDAFPPNDPIFDEKSDAIDDHFQKVQWSDAILVANFDKKDVPGYIGGNTLMEIAVARFLRKKIYIMKQISSQLSCKEEVLGTKPVLLNDELKLG